MSLSPKSSPSSAAAQLDESTITAAFLILKDDAIKELIEKSPAVADFVSRSPAARERIDSIDEHDMGGDSNHISELRDLESNGSDADLAIWLGTRDDQGFLEAVEIGGRARALVEDDELLVARWQSLMRAAEQPTASRSRARASRSPGGLSPSRSDLSPSRSGLSPSRSGLSPMPRSASRSTSMPRSASSLSPSRSGLSPSRSGLSPTAASPLMTSPMVPVTPSLDLNNLPMSSSGRSPLASRMSRSSASPSRSSASPSRGSLRSSASPSKSLPAIETVQLYGNADVDAATLAQYSEEEVQSLMSPDFDDETNKLVLNAVNSETYDILQSNKDSQRIRSPSRSAVAASPLVTPMASLSPADRRSALADRRLSASPRTASPMTASPRATTIEGTFVARLSPATDSGVKTVSWSDN
jgi:hypothetical protein